VQEQYFEFLTALGIPFEPAVWNLGPWPDELAAQRAFFEPIGRPVVSFVIGANLPEREWPGERWAEVARVLDRDYGLEMVLATGRSEREIATEKVITTELGRAPRAVSGLRPLVSLLQGSALVISLDTGPMHMAVALDRPVISLMGYNNPKRVGPYRKFHDLIVDAYGEPGEDYPVTIAHRYGRLPRISVRDVLDRVEIWATRYRDGARP
jgi:heptosyltransferase I